MNAIVARKINFGMSGTQKYRNKPTEVDGIKFPSKKEANRWRQLLLLQANGEVRNIERQVTFRLEVAGLLICKYIADFTYEERTKGEWHSIVDDAKGFLTREYRLKRKLMKACHGIVIRES